MPDLNLTLSETEALLSIVANDMEMCGWDAPDYEDANLMEFYMNRAQAYAKIKEAIEGMEK